jgi:hypothetical protein
MAQVTPSVILSATLLFALAALRFGGSKDVGMQA